MTSLQVSLVGCIEPEARARDSAAGVATSVPTEALPRQGCTTMAHLCRDVYLIASVSATETGSQCAVQLVRGTHAVCAARVEPKVYTTQGATKHGGSTAATDQVCAVNEANIPATLLAAFRSPQVVYVMAQDEGTITTVELLLDEWAMVGESARHRSVATSATDEQRTLAASALAEANEVLARCGVYLLLGTSNGTVLVCNALRATVLFMAQFQYHHSFRVSSQSPSTGDGDTNDAKAAAVADRTRNVEAGRLHSPSPSDHPVGVPPSPHEGHGAQSGVGRGCNQAVVRFAVLRRGARCSVWHEHRRVAGVYVVHEGGKVVLLDRAVLDALADVVRERLDGRRPFFLSDWSPSSVLSTYPLVGPAAPQVAAHVTFVYMLPSAEAYSTAEMQTCVDGSCGPRVIRDAVVLTTSVESNPSRNSIGALQTALHQGLQTAEALVVCGSNPAFALYLLDASYRTSSAKRVVKAVTSLVAGVAKSLWRGALGAVRRGEGANESSNTADVRLTSSEPLRRLEKRPQRVATALLAGDSNFTTVALDLTARWLAFYSEGAGRVYITDLSAEATVCRVLKGCRAAQIAWGMCHVTGGVEGELGGDQAGQTVGANGMRCVTLLFVHLPLRHIVEVYTMRSQRRVAACKVPANATLLSCEQDTSDGGSGDGRSTATVNAVRVYLCTACGELYTVTLRFDQGVVAAVQTAARQVMNRHAEQHQRRACEWRARQLRACGVPGERLALALRLQPPRRSCSRRRQATSNASCVPDPAAVAGDVHVAPRGADSLQAYMTTLQLTASTFAASSSTEDELMSVEWQPVQVAVPRTTAAERACSLADEVERLPVTLTRRQCAVILIQYMRVVKGYDKLCRMTRATTDLRSTEVAPVRLVRAELWHLMLDTAHLGQLRHTIADAVRATLVLTQLSDFTSEVALLQHDWLNGMLDFVSSAAPDCAATTARDEALVSAPQLSTFASLFCYGEAKLHLRHARVEEEEIDTSSPEAARDLAVLGDLLFTETGLGNFYEQLGILAELGLSLVEVTVMVLSWLIQSHDGVTLPPPRGTSVGLLVSVLHGIPIADFTSGLQLVSLPLLATSSTAYGDDSVAAPPTRLRSILTMLILCCVLRCGGGAVCEGTIVDGDDGCSNVIAETSSILSLTLRQLLHLWNMMTTTSPSKAAVVHQDVSEESTCVSLRLCALLPRAGPTDTLESHALRHGASLTAVMHGLHARVTRSAAVLTTEQLGVVLPLLRRRTVTEGERRPSMTVVCAEWVQGHVWCGDAFSRDVLVPLQRGWAELTDDTAPGEARRRLFQQSCLFVTLLDRLHDVLRPLTDTAPAFWRRQTVPDVDLFASVMGDAKDWLRGSRATKDYLQSAQALAHLATTVADAVVGGAEAARCVQVVQVIVAHLEQDDHAALPIVPAALRGLLVDLMRVLAQRPRQVVHRVHAVRRLLALLLFCMDAATFTVDGAPVAPLRHLPIRWSTLLAVDAAPSALVVAPDEILDDATEDCATGAVSGNDEVQIGRQLTAAVREAAGLMRAFLADCVLADQSVAVRCQRLASGDTRALLDRLAAVLDLTSLVPDMTALTLVDYAVKYVMPVNDQLARETWWIGDKGLLARLAASDMRALLGCYLKSCVELRRRYAGQQEQSGLHAEQSRKLHAVLHLMSAECRRWVRQQGRPSPSLDGRTSGEEEHGEAVEAEQSAVEGGAASALAIAAVGGPDWVTQRELKAIDRVVQACLDDTVPTDDDRRRLRELFFVLAQLVVEGDATALPPDTRRIAHELPAVAEGMRLYI